MNKIKKFGRFIVLMIATIFLFSEALFACPACGKSIAESGGLDGALAVYTILAGMPFILIGSVIAGIIFNKRKNDKKRLNSEENPGE